MIFGFIKQIFVSALVVIGIINPQPVDIAPVGNETTTIQETIQDTAKGETVEKLVESEDSKPFLSNIFKKDPVPTVEQQTINSTAPTLNNTTPIVSENAYTRNANTLLSEYILEYPDYSADIIGIIEDLKVDIAEIYETNKTITELETIEDMIAEERAVIDIANQEMLDKYNKINTQYKELTDYANTKKDYLEMSKEQFLVNAIVPEKIQLEISDTSVPLLDKLYDDKNLEYYSEYAEISNTTGDTLSLVQAKLSNLTTTYNLILGSITATRNLIYHESTWSI